LPAIPPVWEAEIAGLQFEDQEKKLTISMNKPGVVDLDKVKRKGYV
jgi:hypothetical protein